MAERKERPGAMLYFDMLRPLLNRLDDERCGKLLRAIVDYSQYGALPDDGDMLTGMAFDLLRPKLDHDAEKYEQTRVQRQYAVYRRDADKYGWPDLSFDEWRCSDFYKRASIEPISPNNENSENIEPFPTTSITPTPASKISRAENTSAPKAGTKTGDPPISIASAGEGKGVLRGEGGTMCADLTLPSEVQSLFQSWKDAIAGGRMKEALDRSSELFRLGYDVDLHTGAITKR
jgi:hypothetical protein